MKSLRDFIRSRSIPTAGRNAGYRDSSLRGMTASRNADGGMQMRVVESITSLGGLLVPISAIIIGGVIAIVSMVHRHQERLAKIERGIDPDGPWPQQK
jgi:hypothetical protein